MGLKWFCVVWWDCSLYYKNCIAIFCPQRRKQKCWRDGNAAFIRQQKKKVSCRVLTKTECKVLRGEILYISMVDLQHVSVQLLISITVFPYGISISVFCKYSDLQITWSTFLLCIIVMTFQLRRASRDAQGRRSERKSPAFLCSIYSLLLSSGENYSATHPGLIPSSTAQHTSTILHFRLQPEPFKHPQATIEKETNTLGENIDVD